jgi:hypothetical protein
MNPPSRIVVITLLLGALAAPGAGAPGDSEGVAPLLLSASRPTFETAEGGAGMVPVIAGFGASSRPGEPLLPLKLFRVAIPQGSEPVLRILSADPVVLTGLDLAPVPTLRVLDSREDRSLSPRATSRDLKRNGRAYARDADVPEAPVRLGHTGYLRDQRFVEVLYSPLVYNPVRKQARFYPEVRAEVRFRLPATPSRSAASRSERYFEDTYRSSLINYEQGKLFRVSTASAGDGETAIQATGEAGGTAPLLAGGVPRYKMFVTQPGIYRIDHGYLMQHAPDLLSADPRTLFVTVDGSEIKVSIRSTLGGAGESDGVFDTDDVLEFFGQPKTEPPTIPNHQFPTEFPDIYQANDFTDTQVYWLAAGGAPGSHQRAASASGAPVNGFPMAVDFEEKAVWEVNDLFLPTADQDPYFSKPALVAGGADAQRDVSIPLPGLAVSGLPATVSLRIRGGSNPVQAPDHKAHVWVNANTAGAQDFIWDGDVVTSPSLVVAHSLLTHPTTVHVQALGLAGVPFDVQYLDRITIAYRRQFTAAGGALVFSYPNQNVRFQVGGFGAVAPTIFDISRTPTPFGEAEPVVITGAVPGGAPTSTYTFEVPLDPSPSAPSTRVFALAAPGGYRVPDSIQAAADPVLQMPGQQADILVIGSAATLDASPGGALDLLLDHRLDAQGLTSQVVDVAQIYDEFGFGRRDVNAIRQFLAYAYANWRGPSGTADPPSFVLLVGDATPDYENNQGSADWVDQVPTPIMLQINSIIGYYSSDNYLASFVGSDQIPDILLGRIPARTVPVSTGVFAKIRQYEQSPPPGLWKGRALLSAGDGNSALEVETFEGVQTEIASTYFTAPPHSTPSPPLYFARTPWNSTDKTGFKNAIVAELGSGDAIFSFVGHGAFDVLGLNSFFRSQDAAALTNTHLPLFVAFDCLAGGFHSFPATGSVGEAMLLNPAGGSVASLAPSGLSSALVGDILSDELFRPLFGREKARVLGVVQSEMHAVLWSQVRIGEAQSLTFLGDPATVLATPAPASPTGLSAVAGNGQVSLDWTAAPQPVAGYRIYRAAASPTGSYVVACSPGTATSCVDTGVINATRYYYYAVSLDGDQFEGAPSNPNDDCDAGPGCVTARPVNPNPPSAPVILAVDDTGIGGILRVTWMPNPETDISKYTIRYGSEPGDYPLTSTALAGTTTALLSGLMDSVRYYVIMTATNTSGLESAPSSPPSSGVPHVIQGIAPPRAISDLRLSSSGNDLVLTWTRPTLDIYGRPTTVTGYKVYRGATPGFMVVGTTPLATIGSPSTTTYTDPGAKTAPGTYYYVVTATDVMGFVSGGGRELPNGISDLAVSMPSANMIHLVWTPPTTDFQGFGTLISHYQVHVTTAPVPRQSLNASTIVLDNVPGPSVDLSLSGTPRYISVIAVDNRGNLSPF